MAYRHNQWGPCGHGRANSWIANASGNGFGEGHGKGQRK